MAIARHAANGRIAGFLRGREQAALYFFYARQINRSGFAYARNDECAAVKISRDAGSLL